MEQTQNFNDILFTAITDRQKLFDTFLLPKLQEEFKVTQSAVKSVQTVLLKKGILRDDPYKYDSKLADIQIPPEDPYTETEKAVEIGRRLTQYEAMHDFLNNYYQFNCDFLNTDRINKLVALNKTFAWDTFSNASTKVNTKGLADLVTIIRGGDEPLSISIINDSLSQLSRSSVAITKGLKNLTDFLRERYKMAVRKMVLGDMVLNEGMIASGAAIKEIKRAFVTNMKGQPFYTELIEEILKEEYSPDHANLQQELLKKLAIVKLNDKKSASEESLKPVLLDGIRTIGCVAPQLDEIALKLQENNQHLLNMDKGFLQKMAKVFRKAFNMPEEQHEIIITAIDPVTQTSKRESMNFNIFIEDIKRRSRIYNGFTLRGSPQYQKIETMEEPLILDLLTRNIAEMSNIIKQFAGFDEYFKQSAHPEVRDRIRGIKVEISAIKNNLVKANQCRAEYASQVEEKQQLKKLGITNV